MALTVRFETPAGEQMQVDWVEFRKGKEPLYAFCATRGTAGPATSSL
jgi:transposase